MLAPASATVGLTDPTQGLAAASVMAQPPAGALSSEGKEGAPSIILALCPHGGGVGAESFGGGGRDRAGPWLLAQGRPNLPPQRKPDLLSLCTQRRPSETWHCLRPREATSGKRGHSTPPSLPGGQTLS